MTVNILQKIESAGVDGIKKVALKKIYGKECDNMLERLKKKEQIFIEKKGVAYCVWSKENYILHLTQNDPKFKLVLDMVSGTGQSVSKGHTKNLLEEMESISNQDSALANNDFETV